MSKEKINEVHYPCGLTITQEASLEDSYSRYRIMEVLDESGATLFNVVDYSDLEIVESYDDKAEAEEAIKFWNQ